MSKQYASTHQHTSGSKLLVLTGSVVLLVAAAGCGPRELAESTSEVAALNTYEAVGHLSDAAEATSLGLIVLRSDTYIVGVTPHADGVRWDARERVPGTADAWESVQYEFATSFTVVDCAARQPDELYVAGENDAHEFVLERWTTQTPRGAHYFQIVPSGRPLGLSSPPVPSVQQGIVGDTYVPVAARPRSLRQQRVVLYKSNHPLGGMHALAVDPENRFVLFKTVQPRAVYQLSLTAGAQPVLVASESTVPELAYILGDGYRAQHGSEGRMYVMEADVPGDGIGLSRVALIDANNDGVFETTRVYSPAAWTQAGMDGPVWTRPDFLDFGTD